VPRGGVPPTDDTGLLLNDLFIPVVVLDDIEIDIPAGEGGVGIVATF